MKSCLYLYNAVSLSPKIVKTTTFPKNILPGRHKIWILLEIFGGFLSEFAELSPLFNVNFHRNFLSVLGNFPYIILT